MSLIFDRFETREDAERFAVDVASRFGLASEVLDTDQEAFADDSRPWVCDPPIVHVDRVKYASPELDVDACVEIESAVESFVENYGGTFCGT